jgi:hypothetical protein
MTHAAASTPERVITLRGLCVVLAWFTLAAGCAHVPPRAATSTASDTTPGVLYPAKGRAAAVAPADLRYTGTARYRWPDGREYDGEWRDGLPHGQGSETLPDGERYTGAWAAGHRDGLGELLPAGGGLYEGEFRGGVREGRGIQFGADGVYQGDWLADREHGYGELAGVHGSRYVGEWRAGLREGTGTWHGVDGSSYQGDWRADHPDGHGVYRFPDGAVYEGAWRAGRQNGVGRLIAASGVTYEGGWADARRAGFGVETRPDGGSYAGEWRADQRTGAGREQRADGTSHEGNWQQNQPRGPGQRHYFSDIDVDGEWEGDIVTRGRLILPQGVIYEGPLLEAPSGRASKDLMQWLTTTADAGNAQARLLAACALLTEPDSPANAARARAWLAQAADAGIAEAAYLLGGLLFTSVGGRADAAGALTRLEQAAGADYAEAHRALGDLHTRRLGAGLAPAVPADDVQAADRYREALRAGSPLAAERLARLLATSNDSRVRNPAEAIDVLEWLALHTLYWQDLDTLAIAYAAANDPVAAVLAEERAIEAATRTDDAPAPSRGLLCRAPPTVLEPPPDQPDIGAMQQRLTDYRALAARAKPLSAEMPGAEDQR